MKNVRIGIVGLGNMGAAHATNILAGKIPRLELTAVSDFDAARCTRFPQAKAFATVEDMIKSGLIDALMIFGEEQRCLHDHIAGTIVIDTSPF